MRLRYLSTVSILHTVKETPQLRIVLNGPAPVYRQIVDQMRTLCVEGSLKPGQKLPSVRHVAMNLGIHFNTVAEAYRALAEEGWLEVKQGSGVRVRERAEMRSPTRAVAALHSSRLRHLISELRADGLTAEWIRREVDSALKGGRR